MHQLPGQVLLGHDIYSTSSLAVLAFVCALIILVPRTRIQIPFVLFFYFMTYTQRILILGNAFDFTRIFCMAAWIRILARGEYRGFRWCSLDKLVVIHGIVSTICAGLLWASFPRFALEGARVFTAAGFYFLVRIFIRDWEEVTRLVRYLAAGLVPVALLFMYESHTEQNPFSYVYPELMLTPPREEHYRCQGAFGHAILAGAFVSCLIPLFISLWWDKNRNGKPLAIMGSLSAMIVVYTCNSSTPLLAIGSGIVGAIFFPFRHHVRFFFALAVIGLVLLHIYMQGPVWSLIARMGVLGGSTAWYRYYIIDKAIENFWGWAKVGTQYTEVWGPLLWDVCDQFVREGIEGGIGRLLLFLAILGTAFTQMGRTLRRPEVTNLEEKRIWAFWISLFMHCGVFIGVSYFAQSVQLLYLTFAIAASIPQFKRKSQAEEGTEINRRRNLAGSRVGRSVSDRPMQISSGSR